MKALKPIALASLLLSTPAMASAGGVDVVKNLSVLFEIGVIFAQVMGFFLMGTGVYSLYTWAKTNGQGSSAGSVIMKILVGTLLVSLGWFYNLMKSSFVGNKGGGVDFTAGGGFALALDASAIGAAQQVANSGFGKFVPEHTLQTVLGFVFLVGLLSFISGVYSLKDITENRNSQTPLMTPSMKILGGVICMNITWFGCLVAAALNIAALCAS